MISLTQTLLHTLLKIWQEKKQLYTEAIQRTSMDGVDDDTQSFLFSAACSVPLQVNWTKSPVASKCYHVVISTNIRVNRRAMQLEGNMWRYDAGEYT
jgi:hypothetical protein